ncbi:MAG: hypothetical protein IJK86_06265 [Lachnospiraceae bacterium]|nr:hypothetical protein [Lachnospiraceae bacterium]
MIRVTIQNDLDSDIVLSFLQNVPVHETAKTHQSTDYRYRILRGENVLSVRSMIEGQAFEEDIVEYLEPAVRGSVSVRIYRGGTGKICFDIVPNVSL